MEIESHARFRVRRNAIRLLPLSLSLSLLPGAWIRPVCAEGRMLTVYTFGDSILDCGHYNPHGVHPGQLLVKNDDRLFPEFRERDLSTRGPTRLEHRAVDGATIGGLPAQIRGVRPAGESLALLTIGGNDLIRGLAADTGAGLRGFAKTLESILVRLPIRPVLIGTVYDPTFGRDEDNFLSVDARIARKNLVRMNEILTTLGEKFGRVVDLHGHFLRGDPSWFTRTIEPSLTGASEIRRAFLTALS